MKPTDIKLTLKLKQEAIQKAKLYARNHRESLSRMVERYFESVAEPPASYAVEITPLVRELSGIVRMKKKEDERELYADYLSKKYSK